MFRILTDLSVKLVKSYLPSPFVFCIILTLAVYVAALIFTNQTVFEAAKFWGDGLWSLLGFSMQMALILVTGHVLAKAPVIGRLLDGIAAKVKSPKQAIIIVTVVALMRATLAMGLMVDPTAALVTRLVKRPALANKQVGHVRLLHTPC